MSGTIRVELAGVDGLRHIEGFSMKRVVSLRQKILDEAVWTKPLAIDAEHELVLDGQHRIEVARALGLRRVPVVRYRYADVEVWSLRPQYEFDWREVTRRALQGEIYPYKTVKHRFPIAVPICAFSLEELAR